MPLSWNFFLFQRDWSNTFEALLQKLLQKWNRTSSFFSSSAETSFFSLLIILNFFDFVSTIVTMFDISHLQRQKKSCLQSTLHSGLFESQILCRHDKNSWTIVIFLPTFLETATASWYRNFFELQWSTKIVCQNVSTPAVELLGRFCQSNNSLLTITVLLFCQGLISDNLAAVLRSFMSISPSEQSGVANSNKLSPT